MKRRNIIYIVVCTLFCFVCLSCSDETENTFAPTETGLILQINAGQNTFTRADGSTNSSAESTWDNVIHYLDVFIFDSTTGKLVPNCYFHFGDGTNIVNPVCLISGNWKTRFQGYETCDVYVVANLHIHSSGDNTASETLKDIENLSELQQLTDEYQNIYQPVSPDSKKHFTMSGYRMGWEPAASSNVYTIPVELTRLAAKIEISLDLQFTDKTTTVNGIKYKYPNNTDIGQLQYSVHNYAINALVLPGNDDTFEYTIASAAEANLKFVDSDDSGKSVPKIIAYTYPTEWTNDILKETYVIFNAQLISAEPISGAYQYLDNYYKIPLRLSTDENKKLERNHWYKVKAIISALGNATPDKPVEIANVHYEVAPWNDMNIDIKGDTPMYLELSEYDVVMRNVDTYDLTFASSSQIKSATINNIYYINKNGKSVNVTNDGRIYADTGTGLNGKLTIKSPIPENKTIRYMTLTVTNNQNLSKKVTIKQYPLEYITGIAGLYSYLDGYEGVWPSNLYQLTYDSWAVDKNTEQQYIIEKSLDNSNIVSGLNIGNNAVMKSKFYVENESGEGRIFRIDLNYFKEYEKVPAGKGNYNNVYTYKGSNKGNYTIKATESLWGDYTKNEDDDYIEINVDGQGGYTLEITNVGENLGEYSHSYKYVGDNKGNYIKTDVEGFVPNLVYYLEDNGTASNNQMYHVVITSTSEDYQLGRPIMSKDTDNKDIVNPYNLDNDNLVSPSFMLASQLGNSSTISWEDAKNQCKNYVEVGINKEVYNDWRLPTAAEINIIIKYQTDPKVNTGNNNAVMDYVLNYGEQSTPNYWISRKNYSMKIPNSGKGTLEQGESNSKRRVRCVRDFHVGEPTE